MNTRKKVNFQKLILGTANFGQQYGITNKYSLRDDEVFEILDRAQNLGISTLDTASAYGQSEELIGKYHSISNFVFKVNTKLSSVENLTHNEKAELIEKAATKLNIGAIENLLFHNMSTINLDSNLGEFIDEILDSGLVSNSIGVSIYDFQDAFLANSKFPRIDLFQIQDNILTRTLMNKEAKEKIEKNKFKMQVRSLFLQGILIANQDTISEKIDYLNNDLLNFENVARNLGTNRLSLCLSYMNMFSNETNFIIAVNSLEQLNEIADAELIDLPVSVLEELPILGKEISDPRNWKI